LVAIGLGLAPFVFILLAFVSRHPRAPRMVLYALGIFLLIMLPLGLVTPALGASAGFGAGGIIALNMSERTGALKRRVIAVVAVVVYVLGLMLVATPAGVFAGGTTPLLAIGFADEATAWKASRPASSPDTDAEDG
jgi:hypothetical protein